MSKRRKRTPWQITSATAPTERTNEQRLADVLEFATQVTEWARETPPNARDAMVRRDATIYNLCKIGVASAGMTEAFRAKYPNIPWAEAMAMQEFFGKPDRLLDHDAVERASRETVPVLLREMTKLKSSPQ